jgi:F0F1-type ATP synthase membrane subunit b/b'
MSTPEPGRTPPALTSLPRIEDLPRTDDGYDAERVEEAFETFRRHSAQLQAQLRVLQAAGRSPQTVEPTGHAVRMDALHLIRAASEFADTLERDAQSASQVQLAKTEEEVRRRRRDLQEREAEVERYRQESERQRAEMLNNARNEARDLVANANRDATQEQQEAEARGNRLLEQARHQATELTNAARAEVEQTLEWARAQASAILSRAQNGAEQLLTVAGLGEEDVGRVANAIVDQARESVEARRPGVVRPPASLTAMSASERAAEPSVVADADDGGAAPAEDDDAGGGDEGPVPAAPQAEEEAPSPMPGPPSVPPTPEGPESAEPGQTGGPQDQQQP